MEGLANSKIGRFIRVLHAEFTPMAYHMQYLPKPVVVVVAVIAVIAFFAFD